MSAELLHLLAFLSGRGGRTRARPDALAMFITVSSVLFLAWLLLKPAPPQTVMLLDNCLQLVVLAVSIWVCIRLWKRRDIAPRCRLPALCLALGAFCFGAGDAIWSVYENILHRPTPFPSWADAAFLSAYPFLFAGVLLFPLRAASPARRSHILADGLTTLTACVTLAWYFLLGPMILGGSGPLWARLLGAAYPFCDLILLFCVLALASRAGSRPAALLTVGLCAITVADVAFSLGTLHGTYQTGCLTDTGWVAGYMLIAYAGLRAVEGSAPDRLAEAEGTDAAGTRSSVFWHALLPYAVIPIMIVLLLYTRRSHGDEALEPGVYLGCAILLCLVLARQTLSLREKHDLNLSLSRNVARLETLSAEDGLTGLLNHRAFRQRLTQDTAGHGDVALAVVLLDITDFRLFNDVYGHAAGDRVLVHIARTLQASQQGGEVAARYGGDEFALLVSNVGGRSTLEITRDFQARLAGLNVRPHGSDAPTPVSFAFGVAVLPEDADSPQSAIDIADGRLRRAKSGGDTDNTAASATERLARNRKGFSLLNAYVTALDAKDRYTRRHSEDVMVYSLEIARELELDEAMLADVEMAALLHDVGKIGVPDAVLRKPGRLTDDEFETIKQHPEMGAVMVSAVPGFEHILNAVRYHHERWDGGGYPDGLIGEETPLIARLMAVADAYSAMTTDRPYRQSMDPAHALTILEGGAGTQWDPTCVRAFLMARTRRGQFPDAQCALRPQISTPLLHAA